MTKLFPRPPRWQVVKRLSKVAVQEGNPQPAVTPTIRISISCPRLPIPTSNIYRNALPALQTKPSRYQALSAYLHIVDKRDCGEFLLRYRQLAF
ncbi:hypothetical protein RSOLAG1IB_00181 [Rhizoctonia solani AG-1 IB]|uniref:Uncharacterized protein n=1 Tax=Thanatephorus cucumeris (strain AG1-IB / isolate 7/3/14) TaxID=1108050 RepID=A0A0B7F0U3_THACB|nr:hypothetical protein RSOLAG1IB_00181 [Rhizoctonia solani AG-1 IB]